MPREAPIGGELMEWLTEALAQRVAEALELMTGEMPQVGWSTAGEPAEELLWWAQPLNLGRDVVVWVGAPRPSWSRIGNWVLTAAGMEGTEEAEARNTYLEILGQAFSGLARDLSARVRREVACEVGKEEPPPPGVSFASIDVIPPGGEGLTLWVAIGSAFREALEIAAPPARVESAPPAEREPASASSPEEPSEAAPSGAVEPSSSKTLDLLLEVELPVSISFGRAELPLRDVLKLTTGSIIELNRKVNEPVEVIVNNCVIARGEVVVIEGNYGIRIQQIISRQERLRTLK